MDVREIKWTIQRWKNVLHLFRAAYWSVRCRFPGKKLKVVGVTGTDGKTTTTTLIYEILKKAKYRVGMISTVGVKYVDNAGAEVEETKGLHNTNPGPEVLQPLISKMVKAGVTHLVLEVTAHGIDQYRVWGCNISIAVLTNVTHEHLDDFVDMERYKKVKSRLFEDVDLAVLNKDLPEFAYFSARCKESCKIIGYKKTKTTLISESLNGDYNKYNIGAAEAVAKIWGVEKKISDQVISGFEGVPGRREEVVCGQKFRVFVDFAHTPHALESILGQLKKEKDHSKNRLIAVFGCTGGRDREKRPIMGKIAVDLADVVIITSDDTRYEDQEQIAAQILSGIDDRKERIKNKVLFQVNDRKEAIKLAVGMAKPGDIVLLAGKGHEKSILHAGVEYPWSDVEVAKQFLKIV